MSKNFDSGDPENPIKYNYDYSNIIKIPEIGRTFVEMKTIKNDYKVNNWWSFFHEEDHKSFYSIEKVNQQYQYHNEDFMILMEFNAYEEVREYETNIIGIIDIIGVVGGFYEILYLISIFFIQKGVDFLFKRDLAKRLKMKKKYNEWFTFPTSSNKCRSKSNKIHNEGNEMELEQSKAHF